MILGVCSIPGMSPRSLGHAVFFLPVVVNGSESAASIWLKISCPVKCFSTTASVGQAYLYDADAIDLNVEDVITYGLSVAPDGMTIDEVIKEYPQITHEAMRAALSYAADVVRQDILLPLAG